MISPKPVRLGRSRRVPIWIHPEGFVLLLAVGMPAAIRHPGAGVVLMAALFLSILAHELGHASVARRSGSEIARIDHVGVLGLCTFTDDGLRPLDRCLIAAAGPAVNAVIAAIGLPVASAISPVSFFGPVVTSIVVMNVGLAVGNLLPIFPLDGGRILFELLSLRWPTPVAVFVTSLCGVILSVPTLLLTFAFSLVGYPIALAAMLLTNWRMLREAHREIWPRGPTPVRPPTAEEIADRLMAGIVEEHRRQRADRRPPT